MAFKSKPKKGQGDWRPNPLIPRCALCILAMIVVDSFVVVMGLTKTYKFVDLLLLCFVFISLCWTTFFLVRPIFRASLLHPGWAVGLDLICFPLIATWSVIGAMQGLAYYEYLGECRGYDIYRDGGCKPFSGVVRGLGWLAYTSAFLMTIIHATLFVYACRDTHRYRSLKRNPNPPDFGLELKGWSPSPYSFINASEERFAKVAVRPESGTEMSYDGGRYGDHSRSHSRSESGKGSGRFPVVVPSFGEGEGRRWA